MQKMMRLREEALKTCQIQIAEVLWQDIAQQVAAADPKPLRGFGRLSSGVELNRFAVAFLR